MPASYSFFSFAANKLMNTKPLKIDYWAVIGTGIVAFGLSIMWYSPVLFGNIWMEHRKGIAPSAPQWTMLFAPFRELIASYVLALLITRLASVSWKKNLRLILLLWLAFHAVGMAGAILWDHMPWKLGAIHAGDWLMKMAFMAIVLTVWHKKRSKFQEAELTSNK